MENMHELDMALLQAIGAIENLLALPCCNLAELSRVRYQTARAVAARRQAVDQLVNAALQQGGARGEVVQSLRGSSFEMRMLYTDHISAWPTAKAVENWSTYVAASKKLGETIRRQVQVERDLLYPGMPPVHA
ncbi:hypothetical protein [Sphingomonas sp. R1]|uniref:hypothetical protein n=1 Tax=Sphingomonas sp. R1 TaxID=399176 RepID=UPI0022254FD1|nr:hypothetical protein [Sphingomonas sp. R1]UYY77983.1 hypothetical protein OIM94_02940 [Sphingomonas sp. R1]